MGGVQRIYTGNTPLGEHDLQVRFLGKSEGGSDLQRAESFTVHKDVRPALVAITLAQQAITLNDR
jgi:hypothetical protein